MWSTDGRHEPTEFDRRWRTRIDADQKKTALWMIPYGVSVAIEGRPDDATMHMRDLGEKTFYGD